MLPAYQALTVEEIVGICLYVLSETENWAEWVLVSPSTAVLVVIYTDMLRNLNFLYLNKTKTWS